MPRGARGTSVLTTTVFLILTLILVSPQTRAEEKRIDINTATVEELETLKGIGRVLARRIVEYREENGPFTRVEEIMRVRGIGYKTFEKIKDHITVGDKEMAEGGGR